MLPWLAGAVFGRIEWVTPGPGGRVTLVQGNIPQDLKWLGTHTDEILDTYRRLSRDRFDTDLVVWPEGAVVEFEHRAGPYLREMDGRARAGGAALVLGIPALERLPDGGVGFLNTVQVVGLGEGRYVKRRLVPFGEYVPLEGLLRGAIEFFDLPMSHAVSGAWHQPLLVAKDWKLATAICYEIVYPDLVRASAADADVIVTLSNDAWFGASIGPHQHLQMARMRALENGRYVLRATNNGITAIVDADGRVTAELPQFEEGVLEGRFEVPRGRPPFVRLGEWPVLVLAAALLLLPLLKRGQARA
jgi:apolipoprotein N-acyltransferase